MPSITKQAVTDNGKKPLVEDVLSDAIMVGDIQDDWIRMSIYGQNRVGKTTLACQFPKPLLIVAFEPNKTGGSMSVKRMKDVVFLRLTSSAAGLQLCKQLQESGGKVPPKLRPQTSKDRFASYVVDGCTSYQDIILQEVMGWDSVPEQLAFGMVGKERYQERAEKVKEGLRPFSNLPGHVIFLAKEKDHNPPKDDYASLHKLAGGFRTESFFAEDVGGSVAGWLHDVCDYIGRLYLDKETKKVVTERKMNGVLKKQVTEVETGRHVHRLRTLFHPNYAAGFRSCSPDIVPEYIEAGSPEEMYKKIMEVINGTYGCSDSDRQAQKVAHTQVVAKVKEEFRKLN